MNNIFFPRPVFGTENLSESLSYMKLVLEKCVLIRVAKIKTKKYVWYILNLKENIKKKYILF